MKRRMVGLFYLFLLISLSEAQTGSIRREIWTGISGSTISSLTSNSRFPSSPNDTALITGYFESQTNWNDNYGTRIRGYVHPPVTGNYIFWVSGNDNCELWLSTDDKQSHKTLIASVLGYIGEREWTKYAQQQSAAIPLVAGKRYYIEGLHKEATNSDNFAVG
ncbi:MAG: hypothetical protein GX640_08505, partial [Fibrobacter sp.]|nr:hypothetical protein [Fibrobacter sp.]